MRTILVIGLALLLSMMTNVEAQGRPFYNGVPQGYYTMYGGLYNYPDNPYGTGPNQYGSNPQWGPYSNWGAASTYPMDYMYNSVMQNWDRAIYGYPRAAYSWTGANYVTVPTYIPGWAAPYN